MRRYCQFAGRKHIVSPRAQLVTNRDFVIFKIILQIRHLYTYEPNMRIIRYIINMLSVNAVIGLHLWALQQTYGSVNERWLDVVALVPSEVSHDFPPRGDPESDVAGLRCFSFSNQHPISDNNHCCRVSSSLSSQLSAIRKSGNRTKNSAAQRMCEHTLTYRRRCSGIHHFEYLPYIFLLTFVTIFFVFIIRKLRT